MFLVLITLEDKIELKNIGALWERKSKSEKTFGEQFFIGNILNENVFIFMVPRDVHYFNEFAPDWSICVRNKNSSLEKIGNLYKRYADNGALSLDGDFRDISLTIFVNGSKQLSAKKKKHPDLLVFETFDEKIKEGYKFTIFNPKTCKCYQSKKKWEECS